MINSGPRQIANRLYRPAAISSYRSTRWDGGSPRAAASGQWAAIKNIFSITKTTSDKEI